MKSFSQLLVERIQAYFKRKYSMDISDETAEEYLHSLGGMFAVFAESESPPSPRPAGDADSSRLDNHLT